MIELVHTKIAAPGKDFFHAAPKLSPPRAPVRPAALLPLGPSRSAGARPTMGQQETPATPCDPAKTLALGAIAAAVILGVAVFS